MLLLISKYIKKVRNSQVFIIKIFFFTFHKKENFVLYYCYFFCYSSKIKITLLFLFYHFVVLKYKFLFSLFIDFPSLCFIFISLPFITYNDRINGVINGGSFFFLLSFQFFYFRQK